MIHNTQEIKHAHSMIHNNSQSHSSTCSRLKVFSRFPIKTRISIVRMVAGHHMNVGTVVIDVCGPIGLDVGVSELG